MSPTLNHQAWHRIHAANRAMRSMLRAQTSSYDRFSTDELIAEVQSLTTSFRQAWAERNHPGRYSVVRPMLTELRRARQALAFRLVRSA